MEGAAEQGEAAGVLGHFALQRAAVEEGRQAGLSLDIDRLVPAADGAGVETQEGIEGAGGDHRGVAALEQAIGEEESGKSHFDGRNGVQAMGDRRSIEVPIGRAGLGREHFHAGLVAFDVDESAALPVDAKEAQCRAVGQHPRTHAVRWRRGAGKPELLQKSGLNRRFSIRPVSWQRSIWMPVNSGVPHTLRIT